MYIKINRADDVDTGKIVTETTQQHDVTDNDLLQRYLDGEGEAFAALLKRYEPELYGFLVRFTGNAALAEDVFQDTFLQVYRSAALVDLDRPFRPWLFTVAANKARDALRKRKRHAAAPLDATVNSNGEESQNSYADLMASEIPSPDEISMNLETRQAVHTIVEQLPENLRMVLALSYFQELPHKEIAEILSVPVGTVKSRMHKAIQLFATKWKAWLQEQNRHNGSKN